MQTRERVSHGFSKPWVCCVSAQCPSLKPLGQHNFPFKDKLKSSVSYPPGCCTLSCNADLFLFSRGLKIGTSGATFEVGHGLLTDVAAVLHAFYRDPETRFLQSIQTIPLTSCVCTPAGRESLPKPSNFGY